VEHALTRVRNQIAGACTFILPSASASVMSALDLVEMPWPAPVGNRTNDRPTLSERYGCPGSRKRMVPWSNGIGSRLRISNMTSSWTNSAGTG
jgi:hypothetical protein